MNDGRPPGSALMRIAVPTPVRRYFDYRLPADAQAVPPIGARVCVPFGSRRVVGVLVDLPASSDVPATRLRAAHEILDDTPLLTAELVAVLRWAAAYYHHAPGEVFTAAMPGILRQGRMPPAREQAHWQLTLTGRDTCAEALRRRAPRQAEVLEMFHRAADAPVSEEQLAAGLGHDWRPALRRMVQRGLLTAATAPAAPGVQPPAPMPSPAPGPSLTTDQASAVAAIEAAQARGGFTAWLLHGVTGSGKTEVYLRAIRRVLDAGGQALVLVPEIGLTPQLVQRLAHRLPTRVVTMHSGMSDGERARAFLAARDGSAGVVLGTRSGVFAPLRNPQLIVVDEEHDASLKQQDGFRYHARDLAVFRARQLGIPVVLGSATPSLESLHNVARGRYSLLRLPRRAGAGEPPTVRLVDLRREAAEGGLTAMLLERMRSHLQAGAQVLLFLNRRGFAPVWMCVECGWIAQCPRCDARLTYHQRTMRLRCHHCGHERRAAERCQDCPGQPRPIGAGTEQVEQAIAAHFPDVPVARIDRDSTRRRGELERQLEDIRAGRTRILIGTQMLTKGHDFPRVTLVGVLNADGGLFSSDFRAPERLAQLIVQVAGRAGRASRGGEVLVQTSFPEHPLLFTLLREGYDGFARAAAAERTAAGWPPFSALAMLRAEAAQPDPAQAFLAMAAQRASDELQTMAPGGGTADVAVLGPAPAPMERRAGRFRMQLLLQAPTRAPLQLLLARLLPILDTASEGRRVRWSVDVDPIELD
jgi:primosomal protein N' (replication factor Y)